MLLNLAQEPGLLTVTWNTKQFSYLPINWDSLCTFSFTDVIVYVIWVDLHLEALAVKGQLGGRDIEDWLTLVIAKGKLSKVVTAPLFFSISVIGWLVDWLAGRSVGWSVCTVASFFHCLHGDWCSQVHFYLFSPLYGKWIYSSKSLPQIQLPHSLSSHSVPNT